MSKERDYTDPFLYFSDGIGTQNILFDRDGSGFLGYRYRTYDPNYRMFSHMQEGAPLVIRHINETPWLSMGITRDKSTSGS